MALAAGTRLGHYEIVALLGARGRVRAADRGRDCGRARARHHAPRSEARERDDHPGDHVKILDFGLAKSIDAGAADMTRAAGLATTAGTILGTFGYMAPEQVRGLPVDHRADIFAFGALLYEMLGGERAFKGETAADTMTAVLTKDPPDLDAAGLSIQPGLDRIVRRCLEKTPDRRFQSANDLAAPRRISGLWSASDEGKDVNRRPVVRVRPASEGP